MTPSKAYAISALIAAGNDMANEIDISSDALDGVDDVIAHQLREMIGRWQHALAIYRGDQLGLFEEAA